MSLTVDEALSRYLNGTLIASSTSRLSVKCPAPSPHRSKSVQGTVAGRTANVCSVCRGEGRVPPDLAALYEEAGPDGIKALNNHLFGGK